MAGDPSQNGHNDQHQPFDLTEWEAAEALDRSIDALVRWGEAPSLAGDHLPGDPQLVRMAREFDLALAPAAPDQAFVARLRHDLAAASNAVGAPPAPAVPPPGVPELSPTLSTTIASSSDQAPAGGAGPTADLPPSLPAPRARRGTSRRSFLAGSLGAAAGLAAGVGAALVLQHSPPTNASPLVGLAGVWVPIANLADIAPGQVVRFTTEQVIGHLIRRTDGSMLALSAACTHMGCLVSWNGAARTFDCPCHAGRFDAEGDFFAGAVRYRPLPHLDTKIESGKVYVFAPAPIGVPATGQTPSATPPPQSTDDPGYRP